MVVIGAQLQKSFKIPEGIPYLAEGGFGRVYGPVSSKRVCNLFKSIPECKNLVSSGTKYVIKIEDLPTNHNHEKVCKRRLKTDILLGETFSSLPGKIRHHFIIPVFVMCTPTEKIEIQPYGGEPLFNILFRQPEKWSCSAADARFMTCISSLYTMMVVCLNLASRNNEIYLTDIKIENMVIDPADGIVRMIDFDPVSISTMPTPFRHTAVKKILPIQAIRLLDAGNRRFFLKRYKKNLNRTQLIQQTMHRRMAKNAPLKTIALFSIIWVFVHILVDVLLYKCTPSTASALLERFDTDLLPHLYHERYNRNHTFYRRRIHNILKPFLQTQKKGIKLP